MRIDNALAPISKHKNLIIVVIGIAAIASYMIPFANLFAIADASGDYWKKSKFDQKKKKFDFKFAKFFQKILIKKLQFIDNSERTTNTFKNFGVDVFFSNINAVATASGSGSLAINQGSNIFVVNILNCPNVAAGGSGSQTADHACTQTVTTNIQANPYLFFGGSV